MPLSFHIGSERALTFCTPPGTRSRAAGRRGSRTCRRACWGREHRTIPTGRQSLVEHMLDEKRHRAADRSQGCRRDYCQTVAGHGQSGGRRGGHICEKGHTFAKGHRLGQRCRPEPGRHIVRSPSVTQAAGAKMPTAATAIKARFIVTSLWCRPESNARVKANVPTIQFSLSPSPPTRKRLGRFAWQLAAIGTTVRGSAAASGRFRNAAALAALTERL